MNGFLLPMRQKIWWTLYVFMTLNLIVCIVFGIALYLTRETSGFVALEVVTVHFIARLLFAIPVYWLIFWKFKNRSLRTKLLLHLITLPIFTVGADECTYLILVAIFGY